MSQEQALQYLQRGIEAAKAKQNAEARQLLQNAIRLDPGSETAWLWLSSVAKDDKERAFCLRQLYQINPQNQMAIKGLAALGITPEPAATAAPKSTVPRPTPDKINTALAEADPLLRDLMTPDDPYGDLAWTHKTRRRAGERAARMFAISIRVVPVVILLLLVGGGSLFVSQNPEVIAWALPPTETPTLTPTFTPTPTPGFTPTPSPTPQLTYTPSPTFDPRLPEGDLFVEMTPTPIYPRLVGGRIIAEAVNMLDRGEYADAQPTLAAEHSDQLEFNPNPFYYDAIASTELGDTERAERILQDALGRAPEDSPEAALLHAGLAYVYAAQGNYQDANRQADIALAGDPQLRTPYYILAQSAIATGNTQEAADVINEGLSVHLDDVYLWILQGELNLVREQYAEAQQSAAAALYIDPTAEEAYLLQARADLGRGDYGLAVLHLQGYLFTYPGSITGWTLLGDARRFEGNIDLAIAAYSQAVNTEDRFPEQISAFFARAALYTDRNQYMLAFQDYDAILDIDPANTTAREGRAYTAYRAARYTEAIEDIDILLEADPGRDDLALLKAQALVDGANPRDEDAYAEALNDALGILGGNFPAALDEEPQQAIAYEYRARILFELEDYRNALEDIDDALARQESGARHYWRGRIQEARGELDEARIEYEWVRLWGRLYSYPFLPDTLSRLRELETAA